MNGTVGIVGGDRQLEDWLRAAGLRPAALKADELSSLVPRAGSLPDVLLVDVRRDRNLLSAVPGIRRHHPALGIAIVCSALEPALMLEAMRAGVNECVAAPVTQEALESAIGRLLAEKAAPAAEGRVLAIVGAKGGVGATTIAVNLAQAAAHTPGDTLLIDFNLSAGDVAICFGMEPKFTVLEALENTHRLDEAFFHGLVVRTRSGLDVLASSPRTAGGVVDLDRVRALINFAARYYRLVVLDVPRSESSIVDALDSTSTIFVVVNQELPTIRNAHRLVARLRQRYGNDRISLLLNRADRQSEIAPEDITKALNARIAHVFPNDYRQAVAALNKGQPLAASTQGRLAGAFHTFVTGLTAQQSRRERGKAPTAEPGMFGWLTPRRSTSE